MQWKIATTMGHRKIFATGGRRDADARDMAAEIDKDAGRQ